MSRRLWCALICVLLSLPFAMIVREQSVSAPHPQAIEKAFHWPNGKRVAVSLSFDDARYSQIDRGLDVLNPTQDPANGVWVDTVGNIGRYIQPQRMGRGE